MRGGDLLSAAFERFEAHQGLDGLCTDDVRVVGDPPLASFHRREGATTDERLERLHAEGVSFSLREVEEVGPESLIFSAVWSHDGAGGQSGSAGLYWGAVETRDGKLARVTYCASRDEAQRALITAAADALDAAADERDLAAERRDAAADERDAVAERRDADADERDRHARERHLLASQRARELQGQPGEHERQIAADARADALLDREKAAQDREAAATERDLAASERDLAAAERERAASERHRVATERNTLVSPHPDAPRDPGASDQ